MDRATLLHLGYIAAAVLFIVGLKMLSRAGTARRGNRISAAGMLVAVIVTLLDRQIVDYTWIFAGLVAGGVIGYAAAVRVQMTSMPELVALFNGFGGLASLLVGWAEWERIAAAGWAQHAAATGALPGFTACSILVTVLIGGVTFTGSICAFLKLAAWIRGAPLLYRGQQAVNAALAALALAAGAIFLWGGESEAARAAFLAAVVLALALGLLAALPIGGGDMPVVISMLNSLSGLAAAAAGFVIANDVLVVAGCLVGASGFVLTVLMCKAMNRSPAQVLFAGFGAAPSEGDAGAAAAPGELKPITAEDAYALLEAARQVVIVPGYGMAVSQAQHQVRELADLLEQNGTEVRFAIHPVAGRMPGHMNVLLAEANVPYEQLVEMDAINPALPQVDVAVVIGANDVVNPAAARDRASPIYGMPIINAHEARTVLVLKRGRGAGFSGLENSLFVLPNTRMLYGDAKASLQSLIGEFKAT
jgi:NAD(P) transhydrogenase subunit beta